MILGGIYNGVKNLSASQTRGSFIIYDNAVLEAKTKKDQDALAWLKFDGILDNNFQNGVNLPTQSLENRQFSNDSIINNPFTFTVRCAISQAIYTSDDITAGKESEIIEILDYLSKSDNLLAILQIYPLYAARTNMHLENYRLPQNSTNASLIVDMSFKEIRASYDPNVNNITRQNNSTNTNSSFTPNNSSNPTTVTPVDNGFITPINPTGDVSSLGQFNSQFGGV